MTGTSSDTGRMRNEKALPVLFVLEPHPLQMPLIQHLPALKGECDTRSFPDGETYLRIDTNITGKSCIVLANLSHPNEKYLPLLFLVETLRELGAAQVGLVAPYLSYMRQDRRFIEGEAITSRIFARDLSQHVDWLVTVDPHLHRYRALDEIYTVPSYVVSGAPALADWLKAQKDLLLIGPDAESEQWVSRIAKRSGHPYVIGTKERLGDREVSVQLPDIRAYAAHTAVIIDDVISSGQTIVQCIKAILAKGITRVKCAAVHGIFADDSDVALRAAGLEQVVTTNTIAHASNAIDMTPLLLKSIRECL